MKISFLCFACLFVLNITWAQSSDSAYLPKTKDEKELYRLTRLMCSASETGDSAAYVKYIDEHFLITYSYCKQNSYGKFATKKQVITKWGKSDPAGDAGTSRPTIHRIQVSGSTGVVHSLIADKFKNEEGKQQETLTWVTDVWVKRSGQWHWLSAHESILNN